MSATVPPAPVSDMVTRLRRVPGLDVDAGLAFVGNSADVYVRLLMRFVGLHEADVHRMASQAESADPSWLGELAHAIKGGAATLGVKGVAARAWQLEQAVRAGEPAARVLELARALESDHDGLRRQLEQIAAPAQARR